MFSQMVGEEQAHSFLDSRLLFQRFPGPFGFFSDLDPVYELLKPINLKIIESCLTSE